MFGGFWIFNLSHRVVLYVSRAERRRLRPGPKFETCHKAEAFNLVKGEDLFRTYSTVHFYLIFRFNDGGLFVTLPPADLRDRKNYQKPNRAKVSNSYLHY